MDFDMLQKSGVEFPTYNSKFGSKVLDLGTYKTLHFEIIDVCSAVLLWYMVKFTLFGGFINY